MQFNAVRRIAPHIAFLTGLIFLSSKRAIRIEEGAYWRAAEKWIIINNYGLILKEDSHV
jgi:hypothetical protein